MCIRDRFGILAEAPKSSPELIYARSEHGFGLISQRSETVQRMYFQCDPSTRVEDWSDDRIWDRLQRIVAGPDGFTLKTGPIIDTGVSTGSALRTARARMDALLGV